MQYEGKKDSEEEAMGKGDDRFDSKSEGGSFDCVRSTLTTMAMEKRFHSGERLRR